MDLLVHKKGYMKICYYDNNILEGVHPSKKVYSFLYELLSWVDKNPAKIVIKSKMRRYSRWEWISPLWQINHAHYRHPKYPIRLKNAVKALFGVYPKIRAKDVGYYKAPQEIKKLMRKLALEKKLIMRYKPHDQSWGEWADVVITMPDGEVVEGLRNENVYFFNCSGKKPFIKKKVMEFRDPKDIERILNENRPRP